MRNGPVAGEVAKSVPALSFFRAASAALIYTLSLHDALPILPAPTSSKKSPTLLQKPGFLGALSRAVPTVPAAESPALDRKSTRPNSSHPSSSYSGFRSEKKVEDRGYFQRRLGAFRLRRDAKWASRR